MWRTITGFADHFTTRELTFVRAEGDSMKLRELCLADANGTSCYSRSQIDAVLAATSQSGVPAASQIGTTPASSSSLAPPVISINGANPAHIQVGDTYIDLGATAKDSADHDLAIHSFLNGSMISPQAARQIDTAQAATDTIDYVATDGAGNTATSTRTVIVEAQPGETATSTAQ